MHFLVRGHWKFCWRWVLKGENRLPKKLCETLNPRLFHFWFSSFLPSFTLFHSALPSCIRSCPIWRLIILLQICSDVPTELAHKWKSHDMVCLNLKRGAGTMLWEMPEKVVRALHQCRVERWKRHLITLDIFQFVLFERSLTCMMEFVVQVARAVRERNLRATCRIWWNVCYLFCRLQMPVTMWR